MKTKTYTKQDGTTGTIVSLESGDEFALNSEFVSERDGKFGKDYSVNVITKQYPDGIWCKLTSGQKKSLDRIGFEKNAVYHTQTYQSKFGPATGIRKGPLSSNNSTFTNNNVQEPAFKPQSFTTNIPTQPALSVVEDQFIKWFTTNTEAQQIVGNSLDVFYELCSKNNVSTSKERTDWLFKAHVNL